MSELKAFDIVVAEEGYCEGFVKYRRAVYDKSEADKVIAELKQKINEAQTELELWRDGSIISETHQKELDEKRHSDYKRCLAIARWCDSENYTACWYHENSERCKWTEKWHKRWLKIAEKFMDNEAK